MSYLLSVIKDTPQSLYMMDSTLTGASGRGEATAFQSATSVFEGAALVANANRSISYTASYYTAIAFPFARVGYERQAFSLEGWFTTPATDSFLLGHASDSDLLYWSQGRIFFTVRLSSGLVGVWYRPETKRAMHVVGVYTGSALLLYVNGELRDSYQLTAAELALSMNTIADNGLVYSGLGVYNAQALATYYVALTADQVRNHYLAGTNTLTMQQSATKFGGVYEKISNDTADTFMALQFDTEDEWKNALYTCALKDDVVQSAYGPTGNPESSTWQTGIDLSAGGTSINGIKLYWDIKGTVAVQTSLDGTTWTTAVNNARMPEITNGYNPTGKILYVRFIFSAGLFGQVNRLEVTGYKTMSVTSGKRPITLPVTATLYDERPLMEYDQANGVYLAGGALTIGPTTDLDPAYAVGFWYYCNSGNPVVNVSATAFYENGAARAARTVLGAWTYLVVTFAAKTDSITITGDATVAGVTVYENTLTAAQVLEIYKSYTGIPAYAVDHPNVVNIGTPAAQVYANDWAITGAG